MKKFQLKKPDIKGKIRKIRNLKKEDVIAYWKGRHERRERILEARRNSAFAKKMQPVYAFMNRFSLIFHALLACIIKLYNRSNFQTFARRCLELYDRNTVGIFVQCVYDLRNLFYCISVQAKDICPYHYQRIVDYPRNCQWIYSAKEGYTV